MESLVETTPLEQLWSCVGEQEGKERLMLLHFVLSRVNTESKYSNNVDDVMELAAMSIGPDTQSDSSDDTLIKAVINERNLPFFESNFQQYASQILSSEAAALRVAYAAETTDLDNSSILQVWGRERQRERERERVYLSKVQKGLCNMYVCKLSSFSFIHFYRFK